MIIPGIISVYRAPDHVENEQQGALYQNEIINALAEMFPAETELTAIWKIFRRTYAYRTWPTPNVLCDMLKDYRASRRKPTYHSAALLPEPALDEPLTDGDRANLERAIGSIPDGPLKATLTRVGKLILERA